MLKMIGIIGLYIIFTSSLPGQVNSLQPAIPELPTTSLQEAGFNTDSIDQLIQLIQSTPPNDFRGLVVIKDNHLVIEEYFNTFWRNTIHDIRSAGKSITALLLGIAMKEGLVNNLNQTVDEFFPEHTYSSIHPDYQQISLRHLLDMSSGLDADTDNSSTPGHAVQWIGKDDWKDYILSIHRVNVPGERWVYADINALLVGAIIEEVSGMSLRDYAKTRLFDPLGIEHFYWYTNTSNQTGAAGNLYITALDFAKIGCLVLNEGRWDEEQILSASFIQQLRREAFDISNNNPYADTYSTMWYHSTRTFGKHNLDYWFASGNGGNHLVVVPKHHLVIALTSSAYGPGGHMRSYIIMSKILAALE